MEPKIYDPNRALVRRGRTVRDVVGEPQQNLAPEVATKLGVDRAFGMPNRIRTEPHHGRCLVTAIGNW